MLDAIALAPPVVVVAVLPSTGGVRSRGLDMPVGQWADPHLPPCRWDDQGLDAREGCGVGHRSAVDVDVGDAASPGAAGDPRACAVGATESDHGPSITPAAGPATRSDESTGAPGPVRSGAGVEGVVLGRAQFVICEDGDLERVDRARGQQR